MALTMVSVGLLGSIEIQIGRYVHATAPELNHFKHAMFMPKKRGMPFAKDLE
jgi:hypothetical protein